MSVPYDSLLYAPGVVLARAAYPAASRRTAPSSRSLTEFVFIQSITFRLMPARTSLNRLIHTVSHLFCSLSLEGSAAELLHEMQRLNNLHEVMEHTAWQHALKNSWRSLNPSQKGPLADYPTLQTPLSCHPNPGAGSGTAPYSSANHTRCSLP